MRILQVANGYPPTASAGVEIYTATLSRELAKEHQVFVLCREGDTNLPDGSIINEQQGPITIRRVVNNFHHASNFADFHHNIQNEAFFREFVREMEPDLVHFQHCIGLSTSMLQAVREMGLPHLVTLHDYWFLCPQVQLLDRQGHLCAGPLKGLNCRRCAWWPIESTLLKSPAFRISDPLLLRMPMRIAERAVRPFTDYIMRHPEENAGLLPPIERAWQIKQLLLEVPLFLTPSHFLRQVYIDYGIPAKRIRVLPLGLNKSVWANVPSHQPRIGPLRLGYIGTLIRHKGIHVLLEALNSLPQEQVELTIHGYGDQADPYVEQLRALAGESVHFAGRYDNNHLPQILAELDAIVIPSVWHETFSMVAREALLAGVPVLASDVGALSELIRPGENGFLFPAGDHAALARLLQQLASSEIRISIDRSRAEQDIWSVEQHTVELMKVYAEVLWQAPLVI